MLYRQIVGVKNLCQLQLSNLCIFRCGDGIAVGVQYGSVLRPLIVQHAILRESTCCRILMVDGLFKKERSNTITILILSFLDIRHSFNLLQHFAGSLDHLFGYVGLLRCRRIDIIVGTPYHQQCDDGKQHP